MLAQLDHAHARAAALHRTSREASPGKHASPSKLPPRQVHAAVAAVRMEVRMLNSCLLEGESLCWAMLCSNVPHVLWLQDAAAQKSARKQAAGANMKPQGQELSVPDSGNDMLAAEAAMVKTIKSAHVQGKCSEGACWH